MKRILILCLLPLLAAGLCAQPKPKAFEYDLLYFMPKGDYTYNPSVPTPEQVIGFQLGQQHVDWGNVVSYMNELARTSPRVSVKEMGRTYQHRPFLEVIFTSEKNQKQIETIKAEHLKLTDADIAGSLSTENKPVVVNLIYSIHGNEPSGVNSSLAVAYWLAAASGGGMEKLLDDVVVVMTPGANPDGINRFASWVNSSRSLTDVGDLNSREMVEPWPSSRTNHYWADCNRDWLMVQHPEGRNGVETFFDWMPNVVTDLHEQGSARQYYFSPGHPKRTHPLTTQTNQDFTSKISGEVAAQLDKIGTGYYSKEGYDDYYYGKGAAYGDIHGAICLLYEQGTSRAHLRNTVNGPRSFAWTVRNQALGSYGTIFAAENLRRELLDYQRDYYRKAKSDAARESVKGYVFNTRGSNAVKYHFLDNMARHRIDVYRLGKDYGKYRKDDSFIIPVEQKNSMMIKAVMENMTEFPDSVFYDISTWTFPHAFNLDCTPVASTAGLVGDKVTETDFTPGKVIGGKSDYGYVFETKEFYAPKVIYELQKRGLYINASGRPFRFHSESGEKEFGYGTIQVMSQNQPVSSDSIYTLLEALAAETGVDVYAATTGLMEDVDLFSPAYMPIRQPKVAVLVGRSMSVPESGEVWHLLDYRFQMQPVMIENLDLTAKKLSPYNVIVLANGIPSLSKSSSEVLKNWVAAGGTLIATGKAWKWVKDNGLMDIAVRTTAIKDDPKEYGTYEAKRSANAGNDIDGVFLNCVLDKTHPLGWGLDQNEIPVFKKNSIIFEKDEDPYVSPLHYTSRPVLSGCVSQKNVDLLKNTPAIIAKPYRSGNVIVFANDMNFRSFTFGTSKIFLNAVFFSNCIK